MPRATRLLAGWLFLAPLGCHAPGPATLMAPQAWVQRQGGLVGGHELDRAQRVAQRVRVEDRPELQVAVLDSATPAAYAWPSGEIFVTRQLVADLENDDDLAAAIAHEVGHLIDGGHVETHAPLGQLAGEGGPESRADRLGCRLLEERGISGQAMVRMLEAVRSRAGSQTGVGRALARRIADLDSASPSDRDAPALR